MAFQPWDSRHVNHVLAFVPRASDRRTGVHDHGNMEGKKKGPHAQGTCVKKVLATLRGRRLRPGECLQTKTEFPRVMAVTRSENGKKKISWDRGWRQACGKKQQQRCSMVKITCRIQAAKIQIHNGSSELGDHALDVHVWVSGLTIFCQEAKFLEALQHDLANPYIIKKQYVVVLRHQQISIEQWYDPRE